MRVIRALRRFERADALFSFNILSRGSHLMRNNITTSCCDKEMMLRERKRERKREKECVGLSASTRKNAFANFATRAGHTRGVYAWLVGGLKRHADSKTSNFVITYEPAFSRLLSRTLFARPLILLILKIKSVDALRDILQPDYPRRALSRALAFVSYYSANIFSPVIK